MSFTFPILYIVLIPDLISVIMYLDITCLTMIIVQNLVISKMRQLGKNYLRDGSPKTIKMYSIKIVNQEKWNVSCKRNQTF